MVGYKQTDIGRIPDDWELKRIDKLLTFGSGQDYKNLSKGDIPVHGTGGVMTYVDKYLYDGDSVGIGRKGTINKPVFLSGKFWTVDTLFYTHNFVDCIPIYIYYKFLMINWLQYNEASGVPSLNKNTLGNIQIPLPPIQEQEAIAEVLSDTDALIGALEKRIAKKRLIKQGAMQTLLTPKDDWEDLLLPQVVNYIHGKAHEQFIDENGKYVVVNSKFISTEGAVKKYSNKNYCSAKNGDVLTVLSDLPNGKALAKCYYVNENNKYAVNQRVCIWRSVNANSLFLYYVLNRNKYFLGLDDGVTQTHILNHHIEKCPIQIPKSIEEQNRIATILSDMDNEIDALEKKLSKTKELKQGLMQQLLTGKIRLV